MGFGDCVRARFPQPRLGGGGDGPGILLISHLDTVHPLGTGGASGPLAFRREGSGEAERAYGPGICDMKGGALIANEAIRAILQAGGQTSLPVTVLLTPDEEVGTPSARDVIEAEARRARYVLIPEPARPDGGVVTGRYAIARFHLEARGRPSHAGARLADGRSAIREMARQILAIEAMTSEDATFSVGVVHGGQWVNCVATTCRGEALTMAKRQADLDRAVDRMLALKSAEPDVSFTVTRHVTRPVWEPDAKCLALFEHARGVARGLGFDITPQSAGGGSDGNFTGAMGIPTLDGLGVSGNGFHTLEEHCLVSSLVPRARLIAGLILTLN
jgi:glutamate carboxypeptidase